ncbi:MAG: porin family protein [Bacteroidales bacterium]|jgi:hypothetical protein|nr:porin family protein [Bacteroidales bacterium]
MKRFFIVLAVVCTIGIGVSHAQEMKTGMSLFNVGLGLVPGIGINASYDYGLIDKWGPGIFTIGGYAGYENWGKTLSGSGDYRVNAFAFAPRATYRYAINSSFEVYATAMLGAIVYSYSKNYVNNTSGVLFGTTAGCRYSFGKNIAVFAEVGYNEMSYLNGGLSFSF